jgi:hypothetical protein
LRNIILIGNFLLKVLEPLKWENTFLLTTKGSLSQNIHSPRSTATSLQRTRIMIWRHYAVS